MARFLIRSFTEAAGHTALERPDGTLPRSSTESYVPWAVTPDNQVVYAKTGEHTGWRGGGNGQGMALRPYDSLMSQNRRRLAESELGLYALQYPDLTQTAVQLVTKGIQSYHDQLYLTRRAEMTDAIYKLIGGYFYTAGGMGFGRISTADKTSIGAEGVRRGIMAALASGTLDQKLSIQDAFGRKILEALKGSPLATYEQWGPVLRQGWFDDAKRRGRAPAGKSAPTTIGGIATSGQSGAVRTTLQARNRGVDSFKRDLQRTREPAADDYYDDADTRNLLFGAGISGTTGTLLQSAFAFAGVLRGEMLKQYVLAIIGYLVGGGMHSYHESMAVARKAGLAYMPGAYLPSLPQSFLSSRQGKEWAAKFYDIVHLGATHWRHNTPSLPSHLNTQLKTA